MQQLWLLWDISADTILKYMSLSIFLILINIQASVKEKYHKAIQIKDPFEAVEYYRQIIREAPTSQYADSSLFRIGMLYYILDDLDKAIDHLELILKNGKKSSLYSKTCYWLKLCYENVGDTTKAKELKEKLKNIIPEEEQEIEELKEKSNEQIKAKAETEFYTVQLGAYEDEKWLELFLQRLEENDIEFFIQKSDNYSRVCSGKFDTKSDAENHLEKLKDKSFYGFVTLDSAP